MTTNARPSYPPAERLDLVEELHGHRVADPYRWLEDVDDARTVAWSEAQDSLYETVRAGWPGRDEFHARLTELHGVGDVTAPTWRGDLAFAVSRDSGQDHPVLSVTGPDGTSRILVDPMAVDPSGNTTLDFWKPSPDGSLLAYGLSEGGTEEAQIRVMDLATGETVDGPIDRTRVSPIAWLPDGGGYYFVRHLPEGAAGDDDAKLHRRVYLHRLGTDPDGDELVFGEGSPRGTFFDVDLSHDGRWLTVVATNGTDHRNALWIADLHADARADASAADSSAVGPADASDGAPRVAHGGRVFGLVQRYGVASTHVDIGRDGRAYLFTNRDAPRGRICVADPAALAAAGPDDGYAAWQDLVAEDPGAVIVDYVRLDGGDMPAPELVVLRNRHAIAEVARHDAGTGAVVGKVSLPGVGTVTGLTARRSGGHEAWLTYTDFATPGVVLRFDARAGEVTVWAEPAGRVDAKVEVVTRHITFRSYDGTDVRMFVAGAGSRGRDGIPDSPSPAILYGYGGFTIIRPPVYDPYIVAWIEAGGIFALVSLRGGAEEGEEWHVAGMRENKQNVFDDFAAAGDWLVDNGLTTRDRLGIFGGSNGGLLVGAALTRHPEKYAAVVCSAPLLDMLRYELFGLGPLWSGEYGTAADPTEFGWLLGYSPYHHVREGVDYPAVVYTVFDGDTRVDPLHARKMCAALQHATTGDRPVLIRRERNVGHATRAVSRTVDLAADRLAFFTATLNP
ncbi:MAG TPA: prolyl oligopeptidase family serine peptidase [Micromonosporaceae bacterium]|nr:prolyl oligopeptidase family serine peptidase [Micromonosporaceae bacterium]